MLKIPLSSFCIPNTLTLMFLLVSISGASIAEDWPTFGHDPQRSGWAAEETKLAPENVSNLRLKWKSTLKNESYSLFALTAPVVAEGVTTNRGPRRVVYAVGIKG